MRKDLGRGSGSPVAAEAESRPYDPLPGRNAVPYLVSGQCCFLAAMLACCAIEPSWLAVKRGISFYGTRVVTIVPYATGFVLYVALTAIGLLCIEPTSLAARRFRRGVGIVLALTLAVPLTPYSVDVIFDWLHIGVATAAFASGFVLGGWLALRLGRDRVAGTLFVLELGAGASMLMAQVGVHDFMIPSELAFELAAFGLVVQSIGRLSPHRSRGIRTACRPCSPG